MNNTVTLPQSVINRLEKISASSRLTPQSIISKAISDRLDYEEWALEQIDAGLDDIKAGRVLSDEEFWKQIEMPRNDSKKTA
jgi:predicted transcriptional regulator